jgi:hypothetical protein
VAVAGTSVSATAAPVALVVLVAAIAAVAKLATVAAGVEVAKIVVEDAGRIIP